MLSSALLDPAIHSIPVLTLSSDGRIPRTMESGTNSSTDFNEIVRDPLPLLYEGNNSQHLLLSLEEQSPKKRPIDSGISIMELSVFCSWFSLF